MAAKLERHAEQLAALGHPVRLAVLRFVVQSGDGGAAAGEIQARVDLPASTLSHHLKHLVDAGMLVARPDQLASPGKAHGISAGTEPGARVHPEVVEAMKEVGIDLSAGRPQFLSDELARGAALLVTMACGDACPHVPGLLRLDWPLEDPKGKPVERVREIRDEIRARVEALVRERDWA
ncbi:MAG TPA: helix-turn-helix domain-containing protein [Polyangiaceae bacterium]|nr:helix-turn-helix domain-containing protein [Polyangiaceae bacterium]